MTRKAILIMTTIIAGLLLTGVASASHITIGNVNVASGGTATADVVLDSVDPINGTSGYIIQLDIANPSVAQITAVSYNSALKGLTNMPAVPFTSKQNIDWTDTDYVLGPTNAGKSVVLCTLTVKGLSAGTTTLVPTFIMFDGEEEVQGADLIPTSSISSPTITVHGTTSAASTPIALPGITARPADPNGDGLYEDLNGDGKISFSDVSLYFNNLQWIQNNEPVSLFDFSRDGAIDFGDIILLYQKSR
jgi:PKD repeat protein